MMTSIFNFYFHQHNFFLRKKEFITRNIVNIIYWTVWYYFQNIFHSGLFVYIRPLTPPVWYCLMACLPVSAFVIWIISCISEHLRDQEDEAKAVSSQTKSKTQTSVYNTTTPRHDVNLNSLPDNGERACVQLSNSEVYVSNKRTGGCIVIII